MAYDSAKRVVMKMGWRLPCSSVTYRFRYPLPLVEASKHNWTGVRRRWNSPLGCKCLDIIATATKTLAESVRGDYRCSIQTRDRKTLLMCQGIRKIALPNDMKPNREKIEAEELVKERLPLTKWELTPKEKEDFDRVMRLIFDAASILRYDLELGEDAIGKTLVELADWATN